MSEDKLIGMIDAKYKRKRRKVYEHKRIELTKYKDGSVSGYEEYHQYNVKGVVRWWRKLG